MSDEQNNPMDTAEASMTTESSQTAAEALEQNQEPEAVETASPPNPARALDPDSLHGRVQIFIEEMINPSLASHGGWVEVETVDEDKGLVTMKMGGGCHGCGASAATMKYGIETAIKDEFPEVLTVEDITDHSTGENPFFMGNPFAGF